MSARPRVRLYPAPKVGYRRPRVAISGTIEAMMRARWLGPAVLVSLAVAAGTAWADRVEVSASYVAPAKAGATGAVSVTFEPKDPDVHVNRDPAPRFKLDPEQRVLVDKQPPPVRRGGSADIEAAGFYEAGTPVTFAVAPAPGLARGDHEAKATITFFYCSKRDGWCRKGTSEVEIPVTVP